jgi:DNA-directed RNA polymerase specialized sigma24 family protein
MKPCFANDDIEDIEQEFMLHVLSKLKVFEQNKGNLSTFIRSILDNKAKNLIKKKMCGKGDGGGILSVPIDDLEISNPEELPKFFNTVAMNDIANRLPKCLRETFELLKSNNITDTAKILGKSKSTTYKQIREIRSFLNKTLITFQDFKIKEKI